MSAGSLPQGADAKAAAAAAAAKATAAKAAAAQAAAATATNAGDETWANGYVTHLPLLTNPGVHMTTLHESGTVGLPGGPPWKGSLAMYMKLPSTALSTTHRYGFVFHYNPTQVVSSYSMDSGIVPNATDQFQAAGSMYAHQQQITLSLLLNRQAEMGEVNYQNLQPPTSLVHLNMLQKYGTNYDLDFLWGAINGDTVLADTGVTAHDIGYLQANILYLTLGNWWKFPVLITQADITHTKFTPTMVPTMTQVDLTMTRLSKTNSAGQQITDTASANPTPSPDRSSDLVGTDLTPQTSQRPGGDR